MRPRPNRTIGPVSVSVRSRPRLSIPARREFPNVYQTANHFNLQYTNLNRRYKGGKSVAESREPQQLFTIAEEHAISWTITWLTASGYSVTHALMEEIGEKVWQKRVIGINEPSVPYVTYEPLGEDWALRFLLRHPHLKTAMTRSIELARITEASPDAIENWYNVLFQTIEEYDTYNCDESGFGVGKRKALHVLVDTEVKQNYQAEPGRQEWVTVTEIVNLRRAQQSHFSRVHSTLHCKLYLTITSISSLLPFNATSWRRRVLSLETSNGNFGRSNFLSRNWKVAKGWMV